MGSCDWTFYSKPPALLLVILHAHTSLHICFLPICNTRPSSVQYSSSSENIAASAEQGFSTNVQVCNDITSGYPEGYRYCQHPVLSLHSALGASNPDGTSTHTRSTTSCSVAEVTSSASPPEALVTTNEPPPNCTEGTHSYNLPVFNKIAQETSIASVAVKPSLH